MHTLSDFVICQNFHYNNCYVWYLIQQKTLTSSPLFRTVLHACDVGIIMDGHEHGHGESRINKKKYIYIKLASNITI